MTGHTLVLRRFRVRLAVTRATNRLIRVGHRLVGFGTTGPQDDPQGRTEAGLDAYCRASPHDAAAWADMAGELRLRHISRQAATTQATRQTATRRAATGQPARQTATRQATTGQAARS